MKIHKCCLLFQLVISMNSVAQKNEDSLNGVLLKVGEEYYFYKDGNSDSLLNDSAKRYEYLIFYKFSGISNLNSTMLNFGQPYFLCGNLGEDNRIRYKMVQLTIDKRDVTDMKDDAGLCYYIMGDSTNTSYYFKRSGSVFLIKKVVPL
ncbi:MAG: hypothetical protein ACHQFX_00760 [Chitinophagales bacterium]